MNINSDGAEIDAARDIEVYGDWIKFVDGEGAAVKIDPSVIRKLYEFAMAHAEEFDEGAWNIDWQPVFATHQISEKVKTLAPISNLHKVNQDLLEALETIIDLYEYGASCGELASRLYDARSISIFALTKAESGAA